jgi:diketogulonate reductase-like aldo/keto reductase
MAGNELALASRLELNNGVKMPILGLGTFRAGSGGGTRDTVLYALEAGYRLIDTAAVYGNETDVGEALAKTDIPREEIFVTTKLWNTDQGYESTLNACSESLKRLGLEYVDLYLIHWPVEKLRLESWKAMEKLLQEEKCRAIGVSNYMIRHLEELLEHSETVPAVNQVEFSPYLYQKDLLEFCNSHKIVLEAYSPLTKGYKLKDRQLSDIAHRYSRSPGQILLRWILQHGIVVIPKSSRKVRIEQNKNIFDFELSAHDMKSLDSLNEGLRTGWDPSNVP